MNRPAKVILPFFLAAASSLAMAEDGGVLPRFHGRFEKG